MVKLVLTISLALALLSQTSVGLPIGPTQRLSKRVDLETAGVIAGGLCALAAVCIGCAQGACLKHDPHDTPPRGGLVRLQPISQGNMNAGRPEGTIHGVQMNIVQIVGLRLTFTFTGLQPKLKGTVELIHVIQ
ncbi:hypothetical protein AX14_011715 [Amanita brunnescens Koide BX004]|nr:hypothetical protein AX14_011715 [Amanita brunnescens Koide BX004]